MALLPYKMNQCRRPDGSGIVSLVVMILSIKLFLKCSPVESYVPSCNVVPANRVLVYTDQLGCFGE